MKKNKNIIIMKKENEEIKSNTSEKILNNNNINNNSEQKKLNRTNFSDTIKILNLLKSHPNNSPSTSFQTENKLNINSIHPNINNISNSNINIDMTDNLTYEEIKAICLNIFLLYAKPIKGQFFLSLRSIFKLLKELEIIKENCLSYVDIEILNQQINKKGDKLNSEQFLDLLAKICCLLDDTFYKDKRASFIKLIKKYILPFYIKISNGNVSSKFYCDETFNLSMNLNFKNLILNEYDLDTDSFDVLSSIIEGIKIIYEVYFYYFELTLDKNIKKIHDNSFSAFIKFLKDFDITPFLINQRLAELYWYLIISEDVNDLYKINQDKNFLNNFFENKNYDLGKIYTFKKFFLLLSHISFYYYYPIKTKTKAQKLLYIIEKIYKSKGYQNMPNIYCKTFSKKYSIIPPVHLVEKIMNNIFEDKTLEKSQNNEENLKKFLELNDENYNLIETYIDQLKNIFDIYCQINDRSQHDKMTFSNLLKLMFDGDLLLINDKINQQKNTNNNIKEISKEAHDKDNNEEIELSNINKEKNNNKENILLNEDNNNDIKKKLKLIDLNMIISKICGNQNLLNYNNKFSKKKQKKMIFYQKNFLFFPDESTTDKGYKIDFILFLKSLILISQRLYPNSENDINISMNLFLNNDIENFISNLNKKIFSYYPRNDQLMHLYKLISSTSEITQLMNDIESFILTYYNFYAFNGKLNFRNFIKFFKDYEIYPLWINLSNISDIYHTQIYKSKKKEKGTNNIIFKNEDEEKIDFIQFLECFIIIGLVMDSGNDLDMIDKVLFLIDKMFADNYGKVIKQIRSLCSVKEDFIYFEKILMEKYPSYYERKYSNAGYRYDNKFYWVYEKNYVSNKFTQQIDFGELFHKEKVKFDDVFEDNTNIEEKKEDNEYENNETINEIKEE